MADPTAEIDALVDALANRPAPSPAESLVAAIARLDDERPRSALDDDVEAIIADLAKPSTRPRPCVELPTRTTAWLWHFAWGPAARARRWVWRMLRDGK